MKVQILHYVITYKAIVNLIKFLTHLMICVLLVIQEHYVNNVTYTIIEKMNLILHLHNSNAGHVKSKFVKNIIK